MCPQTKAQIVAESYETSVGEVADRYSLGKTQVFTWRRDAKRAAFAQVVVEDAEPEPLTSERARYEAFALRRQLVTLLLDVRDFELAGDLPPPEAISRAPDLTISRVASQFCLRQLEALT